ncbi:MAG TPA: hypothetical protein VGL97_04375 [Bryobacteraceae bacterium]
MPKLPVVFLLLLTGGCVLNGRHQIDSSGGEPVASNLRSFVEANIKATHAYQALQAKTLAAEPDRKRWNVSGASEEKLNRLIELQKEMLSQPIEGILAWSKGEPSKFNEKKYIRAILNSSVSVDDPKLPVNVWISWFKEKSPKATLVRVESLANLQQVIAEVNRDGDLLQDLFRVYSALHLPVYFGQLGVEATSDQEFMIFAEDISSRMPGGPYNESPPVIRMAFRKMYNWGRRYSGDRDKIVMANELLRDPAMHSAITKAATVGSQRVAIIGHSFTMEVHWATPGSFVPVVSEMMKNANPKMQFKYFQEGGMDATRAYENVYHDALKWHPDVVLFVVMDEGPENRKALKAMVDGFTKIGAKCVMFDSLWPADWDQQPKKTDRVLSKTKLNIIEVRELLMSSPDKDKFLCLDSVHMTEPWHVLMAREWFKYLAGARTNELDAKTLALPSKTTMTRN